MEVTGFCNDHARHRYFPPAGHARHLVVYGQNRFRPTARQTRFKK